MRLKNIAIPAGTLLLGVIIGSAANGGDETSVSADAPTVTKTVTKEAEPVEVTVIPESCTDALDSADQGFELAGEAFLIMGEAFEAISQYDVVALESALASMDAVTAETEPVLTTYRSDAAACRSEAQTH